MKIALLYPPLTDPTSGYHSLSYLQAHAANSGFPDIDIIDTNIEAFHSTLSEDTGGRLLRELRARHAEVVAGKSSNGDPDAPGSNNSAVLSTAIDLQDVKTAVAVLRDGEIFYDYPAYRWSVERVSGWMQILSAAGHPGQFSRNGFFLLDRQQWFNFSSVADLADAEKISTIARPFAPYFEELSRRLRDADYGAIGINVTYTQQLPFALYMAKVIRAAHPDALLLCGGTEVSDVWKYLSESHRFFEVFDPFDVCVIGEGETAFVDILESRNSGQAPKATENILVNPRLGQGIDLGLRVLRYENIKTLPTPSYKALQKYEYLSPHRFVYYTPSRGCYWNKCTFCDYGLNGDSPTSPWRQDSVANTLRDLEAIAEEGAEFVYFSVDVLAPATMIKIAKGIKERNIKICWGAEIRLEEYWSPERCQLLRESGCIALSVGFESANRRILSLIDKGTTPDGVLQTITNLHNAGIGVQMMAFTGFPGETPDEAFETIQFLKDFRDRYTVTTIGSFVLTPGAIIAKKPSAFGIEDLHPRPGDDIRRMLEFEPGNSTERATELRQAKGDLLPDLNRPWAGGVDAPHTLFYHARYGNQVARIIHTKGKGCEDPASEGPWLLNGRLLGAADSRRFIRVDGGVFRINGEASALTLEVLAEGPQTLFDLSHAVRNSWVPSSWRSLVANRLVTSLSSAQLASRLSRSFANA